MAACDVLVIGGTGVDTIVRVPALPVPLVDSIGVPAIVDYVAHTGNGVALGCQALGLRTRLADFIGDDVQGRMILDRYRQTGLDFHYLLHASGTRRSVNLVDAEGRRLSFYDGRHPDDLRMPRDFLLPLLAEARHLHVSIMPWCREWFAEARERGMTTSTDLHDWDGVNPYHKAFALQADLIFLSAAALGGRRDEVMRSLLAEGRARAVIVMAGGTGSYLLERRSGSVRHIPCAPPPGPVVDSNGAGDSFVAAFLYGYLKGMPLEACMRDGAAGGAYACTRHGTHENFIDEATLLSNRAGICPDISQQ
jgi:acarbose 7IV-phosphotransferase